MCAQKLTRSLFIARTELKVRLKKTKRKPLLSNPESVWQFDRWSHWGGMTGVYGDFDYQMPSEECYSFQQLNNIGNVKTLSYVDKTNQPG